MDLCDGVCNSEVNTGGSNSIGGGSSSGVNDDNDNHNDNRDDNNSNSSSNNAKYAKKTKLNSVDDKDTPRKMRRSIAMRNAKFNQSGKF